MAKSRPSVQKRRAEARKLERQQIKAARKAQREAEQAEPVDVPEGEDPDLVGIVPGPQPLPYDDDEEFEIKI